MSSEVVMTIRSGEIERYPNTHHQLERICLHALNRPWNVTCNAKVEAKICRVSERLGSRILSICPVLNSDTMTCIMHRSK